VQDSGLCSVISDSFITTLFHCKGTKIPREGEKRTTTDYNLLEILES
jgi:hypothetical protein